MAVDPQLLRQYASIYGGGGQGAGGGESALANVASAGIGMGIAAIPRAADRINQQMADTINKPFNELQGFYGSDVSTWKDLDMMPASAGQAFLNLKQSLNPRQQRIAKRKGMLNPVQFIQQYNQQKDMIVPLITSRLRTYKEANKKSNSDMEKLMKKLPNLSSYLINNASELDRADMPYLIPSTTAMESLGNIASSFEGLTNLDPTTQGLGSLLAKGAVGVASPVLGGIQLSEALGKGVSSAAGGGKGARIAGEAVEGLGTQASLAATRLVRDIPGIKEIGALIKKAVKKKGTSGLLKKIATKLGPARAAGIIAKLGIGSVGGALTGGALTAAMAGMAAKDIYDIVQILREE
jgi:hypothetical protein